ncbi:hypothetical protein B0J15DRAFT_515949 [Fusarium solani]|uniref:Cytochrome b561 domain-containing protein n=1 Tax=Fusarium solani TaxID=169388 RepID=A0A9P9K153_FUSSL|nr:uncharacterized protein B0J15DRAFT_515949 [Fusarium solani]KAH7240416.1 hypothetical protein B0J15DRAFT_515949 [Fusarium solani]
MGDVLSRDYVEGFLKHEIDALHHRETCWHQAGTKGLYEMLQANISESPEWNPTIESGLYNVSSFGNDYSIELLTRHFIVNGIHKSTYMWLTFAHIFTMAAGFFLVYPIILLLQSVTVLCDLINNPVAKHKVKRWETILQGFGFCPLLVAGLTTGILAMGTSDHFRTEHGIIGIVTSVLASFIIIIHYIQLYFNSRMSRTARGTWWRQNIHYFDMAICQIILVIAGFALSDGFDDLAFMGLCAVQLSTKGSFSLGMTVVFIWNSAVVMMTAQWFLVRRAEGETTRLWRLVRFRRRQRTSQSPLILMQGEPDSSTSSSV